MEKYGEEWKRDMMRLDKEVLVDLYRDANLLIDSGMEVLRESNALLKQLNAMI